VIPGEYDEERTDGWWHKQQPGVCESIVPNLSRTIQPSDRVDLFIRSAIEEAEVKVAVRVVDSPIGVAGVEYGVNDEIGERKEEARYSSRVGDELVPT
jgi:hypothetical protein